MATMDIDVFISYHTESSQQIADAIVNKLESKGIRCWYAPRNVQNAYGGSIANAINSCKVFLLILNRSASESVHVLNEISMATDRLNRGEDIKIIPFHVADQQIEPEAKFFISRLHWIDAMTPPMEEHIDKLAELITNMLSPPAHMPSTQSIWQQIQHADEFSALLSKLSALLSTQSAPMCLGGSMSMEPILRRDLRHRDDQKVPEPLPTGTQNEDGTEGAEADGPVMDAVEFRDGGNESIRCQVCDNPLPLDAFYCPCCGNRVIVKAPDVELKKVDFSVVAPKELRKGDYSIIHVVMYDLSYRAAVDEIIQSTDEPTQEIRAGVHKVKDGANIKIVLDSRDIEMEDNIESGIWQGNYLNFSFAIMLPDDYKKQQIMLTAAVYVNDVIATKLKFIIKCSSSPEQEIAITREDVFTAFMSYASQDRRRVAAIIQGMKKARPDMDIFFDVESLRSGDDWKRVLYQEIEKRDILFLCWSHFARESKWVEVEWKYALERKGVEGIEPIPIERPDVCPPPEELNQKHFNDKMLYIINAAEEG